MSAASKPRRKAAKGHKLPEPIPLGFEVTDVFKKRWIIGSEIGVGGFGVIYLASQHKSDVSPKSQDYDFVIKIEYHENGPLFSEMHCYHSIGKADQIKEWTRKRKLSYLGVSPCHGTGSFEYLGSKYRFMILERYGRDLQSILNENGKIFPVKTAYTIAISVLNVLEYIHSCGYLHNDIKAANLLLGRKKGTENQVYVVDFGLAHKYLSGDGSHKKSVTDPRKAHNGTIEYTSRDAHRGSCSRRSDLEVLGFNLVHWLCKKLPWEGISNPVKVQELKCSHMDNIPGFLKTSFSSCDCPAGLLEYLQYIQKLEFDELPNYDYCRKVLNSAISSLGYRPDGILVFEAKKTKASKAPDKPSDSEKENAKKTPVVKPRQAKRKEKPAFSLEPGVIPTPAMLAVMNKAEVKNEKPAKSRKKNTKS